MPKEEPKTEIEELEEELRTTKYNKHTQFHIGKLKAKLAMLREKDKKAKSGGARGYGYGLRKSGDGTILLVGFPSVGKSSLLNILTSAESRVGSYDFTTIDVIPGVLLYRGAKIQVLDVPGIIEGVASGKGRGKEILAVVRNADLVVMILDSKRAEYQYNILQKELHDAGFRLNEKPPEVFIQKRIVGGLHIQTVSRGKNSLSKEMIKQIVMEMKLLNAEIVIREDITIDRLIDAVQGNKIYVKTLPVINKVDLLSQDELSLLNTKLKGALFVSATEMENIEAIRESVWKALGFVRIYMKRLGKEADRNEPLIMKEGVTVKDVCEKIHKEWAKKFKFAKIWGKSARFPGQEVGFEQLLQDEDVVEFHMER